MATYFVGIGGNDGNTGLSWAQRFLTLNAAEDVPIAADDLVHVGPGAYRELLTCDVSGGAGTEIVYVADVTGENTDGVGGIVRITGSDNDQTAARANCIFATSIDYRVFRGFYMDTATGRVIDVDECEHWEIQDCTFENHESGGEMVWIEGTTINDMNVRRCVFFSGEAAKLYYYESAGVQDAASVVENCIFVGGYLYGIGLSEIGGVAIRNCFFGTYYGVRVTSAPPGGYTTNTVENCIFQGCRFGVYATAAGEITEDYNNFCSITTPRTNTNVGGNSTAYATLLQPPVLYAGAAQASGFKFSWLFGGLSQWSQIAAITGNNEPAADLWGTRRPATAVKNSWGPTQFRDMEAETGTVQAGTYARVLHDAGCVLARRIPVTGVEITVTLYVRRETNYAGNLPRMIIKQPGQGDQITTMVAAINTWEQLSDTFTPAALPGFVEVWVESRNTAVALAYEVFYDTMGVA